MASRRPGAPGSHQKNPSADFRELREQFERRVHPQQQTPSHLQPGLPNSSSASNLAASGAGAPSSLPSNASGRRRSLSDGTNAEKLIGDHLLLSPVLERDTPSGSSDAQQSAPAARPSLPLPPFLHPRAPPASGDDKAVKTSKVLVENLIDYVFALDKKNIKEEKAKLDKVAKKEELEAKLSNAEAQGASGTTVTAGRRAGSKKKSTSQTDLTSNPQQPVDEPAEKKDAAAKKSLGIAKSDSKTQLAAGVKAAAAKKKQSLSDTKPKEKEHEKMSVASAIAGNVMTLAEQVSKIPVMVAGVAPPEANKPEEDKEQSPSPTNKDPIDTQEGKQTRSRKNSRAELSRSSSIGPKKSTGNGEGAAGAAGGAGGAGGGGGGGKGRRNASSPTMSPQHVSQHVTNTGPRRVLVLAAKGDWPAVDLILRSLEKNQLHAVQSNAGPGDPNLRPLADVADEVRTRSYCYRSCL